MLPGLTQREFQELLLSVGKTARARRPLSPVEVGELCAKAIQKGVTPKELTEALQMTDRNMVSKFLRMRELIFPVRHLVSWGYSGDGAIGFSAAAHLARLPEDKQATCSEAIVKYRLTRDEMVSVLQLLERSEQPLEACVHRVVHRRPIVSVRQVVLGAVTCPDAEPKLRSLSQLQRDELLKRIVCRLFPTVKDFTAKLGIDRFAVIGGKSVADTVARDPKIERNINTCLKEELA
jgi:hypothetical protein